MTRLAQLLHYTSLSQALFSKPLSPIGPTQPSRGNVTRRIACWTFQDGHLVSFYFFCFFFWFVSFHTFPCCPLSTVSLYKLQYCLSLAFVFYICYFGLFWLLSNPPPPSLFLLQLRLVCGWVLSRLLRHTGGMCIPHGMLGGSLTLYSLVTSSCCSSEGLDVIKVRPM